MGTSNIEISILKKRLELLEMKIGELNSINPEILNASPRMPRCPVSSHTP